MHYRNGIHPSKADTMSWMNLIHQMNVIYALCKHICTKSPGLSGSLLYSGIPLYITKCHSTEKNVRYSGVYPVITNYLVNNKTICYSGVTKLNQAENGIYTMQNSLQT